LFVSSREYRKCCSCIAIAPLIFRTKNARYQFLTTFLSR
jgi:hypothetical protein